MPILKRKPFVKLHKKLSSTVQEGSKPISNDMLPPIKYEPSLKANVALFEPQES